MSRFVPQADMTASDIVDCSYEARAIIELCRLSAATLDGAPGAPSLVGYIGSALGVAIELLAVVHDAVESHERRE